MSLLYPAALFATVLRCQWIGYIRFPGFLCFLGLQGLAALSWVVAGDYDVLTERYVWLPLEVLSVFAAAWATAEIAGAAELAGVRILALQGLAAILAIAIAAFFAERGAYGTFLVIRQASWVWLALVLAGVLLASWQRGIPLDPELHKHAALFAALMLAHACIAPLMNCCWASQWFTARGIYRGVAIGCCVGWSIKEKR